MIKYIYLIIAIVAISAVTGCTPDATIKRDSPLILSSEPCLEGIDKNAYNAEINGLGSPLAPVSATPRRHYLRAAVFYCSGKAAQSLLELNHALTLEPSGYETLMLRARIFMELDESLKALKDLEAVAEAYPEDTASLIKSGNISLDLKMLPKASNNFFSAIKRDGRSSTAYIGLAEVSIALGEVEKALGYYERALKFAPDSAELFSARGRAYIDSGLYNEAINDIEKAITLDTKLKDALLYDLAYSYLLAGQYEKAVDTYTIIINSKKEPLQDYFTFRAISHYSLGHVDLAHEDYKNAASAAPEDPKMQYNLGNIQAELAQTKEAIRSYNNAIKLDPEYYEALINRGRLYFDTQKYFRSLIDYSKAIDVNPDAIQGYIHRGSSHIAAEMYSQAEEDFKIVLEIDPTLTDIIIAMSELGAVRDEALISCIWLNKAVARGFSDWNYIWQSPAYNTIRHEECYKSIVPPEPVEFNLDKMSEPAQQELPQ